MSDANGSSLENHMSPVHDELSADERGLHVAVLVVLAFVVLGGAFDLYMDDPEDWVSLHVVTEVALITISAAVGVMLFRAWRRTASALAVSERSRTLIEADRSAWKNRAEQALQGLGQAIDAQFDVWQLTPAERDVALALLQGHGHKQIAYTTGRSESTVRQHAVAVYSKSGQSGRAELAAFFLGGLMLPSGVASPPTAQPIAR